MLITADPPSTAGKSRCQPRRIQTGLWTGQVEAFPHLQPHNYRAPDTRIACGNSDLARLRHRAPRPDGLSLASLLLSATAAWRTQQPGCTGTPSLRLGRRLRLR